MANAFRSLKAGGVFICRSNYLSTGGVWVRYPVSEEP
jgi:hypothetical protein